MAYTLADLASKENLDNLEKSLRYQLEHWTDYEPEIPGPVDSSMTADMCEKAQEASEDTEQVDSEGAD